MQQRVSREGKHVQALGEDVLAELAGRQLIALCASLVEELRVEQVDLAQVRLRRIPCHTRAVLDRDTRVGVTLYADARQQGDLITRPLAEPVLSALADGHDAGLICSCHAPIASASRGPQRMCGASTWRWLGP